MVGEWTLIIFSKCWGFFRPSRGSKNCFQGNSLSKGSRTSRVTCWVGFESSNINSSCAQYLFYPLTKVNSFTIRWDFLTVRKKKFWFGAFKKLILSIYCFKVGATQTTGFSVKMGRCKAGCVLFKPEVFIVSYTNLNFANMLNSLINEIVYNLPPVTRAKTVTIFWGNCRKFKWKGRTSRCKITVCRSHVSEYFGLPGLKRDILFIKRLI